MNNLAAIINIHDVVLAQQFVDRVVGLRAGRLVFDGSPAELTSDILTEIYGEEDWSEPGDDDDRQKSNARKPEVDETFRPFSPGMHP